MNVNNYNIVLSTGIYRPIYQLQWLIDITTQLTDISARLNATEMPVAELSIRIGTLGKRYCKCIMATKNLMVPVGLHTA